MPYGGCPQAYVGQSGRTVECRMKEHKRAVEHGNIDTSAIAEHAWKEDHMQSRLGGGRGPGCEYRVVQEMRY